MRICEKPLALNDNVKALTDGADYCDISTATALHNASLLPEIPRCAMPTNTG